MRYFLFSEFNKIRNLQFSINAFFCNYTCASRPVMSFDIVLEKSRVASREYRYSTSVQYEISSMAKPFDDKRTLTRRGRKPKCVHPVHQREMNSTN